jgi:hypothetical protein
VAAKRRDRAGHHGLDASTLADFATKIGGDALVPAPSHVLQGLLYFRFRNDIEKWRLLELRG